MKFYSEMRSRKKNILDKEIILLFVIKVNYYLSNLFLEFYCIPLEFSQKEKAINI